MDQVNKPLISDFFSQVLGFEPEMEIKLNEHEILVELKLDPNDSGLLIGYRGEVLTALQLILSLMHQQQTNLELPLRLNINDYRQQREQALQTLAQNTAAKALATGHPISIGQLTSYERRLIHVFLADHQDVQTHSEGEAPHRVLVVSPTQS